MRLFYGWVPYNSRLDESRQVRKEATVIEVLCAMGCLAALFRRSALSYQVIARKWRPKTFEDLVGQSHISQTLLNALKNDRLHHALLFTGPRGTGKTSSARILAKSLRCPNATDFVPCNECSECLGIANGSSMDVMELDGASNNGVDAIRELRDKVGYMPSSGQHKLYIIDEVHMLSTSAFNALLKTLEEPPAHVIFVMATTEAHKIPNTILSRCQRYDFRRIPIRMISDRMQSICEADGIQADSDALWMIARQGDGSMRDSQSLLDQVITFSDGTITLEKVTQVLGLTDRSLLIDTLMALTERDTNKMVDVIERIFVSGYDPKIYAQDLLEELRHLLLVKVTPGDVTRVVDLPDNEIERLQELAERLSSEDVHLLFDMALKGGGEIPRAQDPKVVLEMLLLRMAAAPRIANLIEMSANAGEGGTSSGPKPSAKNQPSPSGGPATHPRPQSAPKPAPKVQTTPADPPPAKPEEPPWPKAPMPTTASVSSVSPQPEPQASAATMVRERPKPKPQLQAQEEPPQNIPLICDSDQADHEKWFAFVARVKRVNPLLAAKLENTFLVGVQGKTLNVGVPAKMKFLHAQLDEPDFKKKLINYLATFWGPGFDICIESEENGSSAKAAMTPKMLKQRKDKTRQEQVRQEVESHPLIKSAQSLFKTEIKAIKELK